MWKCRTFGNWENIAFGLGLFTLTEMAKKQHEWEKGSDGEMGMLVPTLSH